MSAFATQISLRQIQFKQSSLPHCKQHRKHLKPFQPKRKIPRSQGERYIDAKFSSIFCCEISNSALISLGLKLPNLNSFPSKHKSQNTQLFKKKKRTPYLHNQAVELHIRHFARHFAPFFCRFVQVFSCHCSSPFHSLRYLQGNLKGALETNDRFCVRATAQNRMALGRWSLG